MKNRSSIKASYKEFYAAVRTEGVLGLIAVLDKTRVKHGAMIACDLSEKAHEVFSKETEIKRHESLTDRLSRYKRQKLCTYIQPKPRHETFALRSQLIR
jgi:hypothetical protein